jgi:WD40 repeat protein
VGGLGTGALSPDGRTLILSPYQTSGPPLWDLADPSDPRQLALPQSPPAVQADLGGDLTEAPAFSASGRTVASAGTSSSGSPDVVLWNFASPSRARQVAVLTGHTNQIEQIGFHPGGNLVAAASDDATTIIWDIADRAQPFAAATLRGHTDIVSSAVFSQNGRLLVDGSDDDTAIVWDLGVLPAVAANPAGIACQIAAGGLTRAQWRHWAPGLPFRPTCPAGG